MFTFNIRPEELIDTCWDVKGLYGSGLLKSVLELIDTCWDVKPIEMLGSTTVGIELIDTCWDVKNDITVTKVLLYLN